MVTVRNQKHCIISSRWNAQWVGSPVDALRWMFFMCNERHQSIVNSVCSNTESVCITHPLYRNRIVCHQSGHHRRIVFQAKDCKWARPFGPFIDSLIARTNGRTVSFVITRHFNLFLRLSSLSPVSNFSLSRALSHWPPYSCSFNSTQDGGRPLRNRSHWF